MTNDAPAPDTKDWTWVVERRCPECGFDASVVPMSGASVLTGRTVDAWREVLDGAAVDVRPSPLVWSPLEYGCHVRDVYELFAQRIGLMRTEEDPPFADWDQDATAIERHYSEADPAEVREQLTETGRVMVDVLATIGDDEWQRPGHRSNGSAFTIESLTRYFLHDVVHHLHDAGAPLV